MKPGAGHFVEASELIWRSCQNLLSGEDQISQCRSHYLNSSLLPAKTVLADVNKLILGVCVERAFRNQRAVAIANAVDLDDGNLIGRATLPQPEPVSGVRPFSRTG